MKRLFCDYTLPRPSKRPRLDVNDVSVHAYVNKLFHCNRSAPAE